MEPLSLSSWLTGSQGRKYTYVAFLFCSILASIIFLHFAGIDLLSWVKSAFPSLTYKEPNSLIYVMQFIFIIYALFFVSYKYTVFEHVDRVNNKEEKIWEHLRLHKKNETHPTTPSQKSEYWMRYKRKTNKVCSQFTGFWSGVWLSWLVLWCLMTINCFKENAIPASVINLANNLSSLMFIFLFMTLTITTSDYAFKSWFKFFVIIMGIFIFEILLEKSLPLTQDHSDRIDFWFKLLSGVIAGVSMAAFLGGLNSRAISIPIGIFLLLYLYSAIQPLYIFLEKNPYMTIDNPKINLAISGLASFLKIILFLNVTWILQTGRLTHLMVQEGSLHYENEEYLHVLVKNAKLVERKVMMINDPLFLFGMIGFIIFISAAVSIYWQKIDLILWIALLASANAFIMIVFKIIFSVREAYIESKNRKYSMHVSNKNKHHKNIEHTNIEEFEEILDSLLKKDTANVN